MIPNKIEIKKDYAILTTFSKFGREYKVDIEDIEKVSKYQFYSDKNGYALCKRLNKIVRLHRLVMSYDGELSIDHINRDTTDNRKENLRIADSSIQNKNRKTPWDVEKRKVKTIINSVVYESIAEASKLTGIPRTTLNDIKLGRYESTRKYNDLEISFGEVVCK